jgi:hypothetical protein
MLVLAKSQLLHALYGDPSRVGWNSIREENVCTRYTLVGRLYLLRFWSKRRWADA